MEIKWIDDPSPNPTSPRGSPYEYSQSGCTFVACSEASSASDRPSSTTVKPTLFPPCNSRTETRAFQVESFLTPAPVFKLSSTELVGAGDCIAKTIYSPRLAQALLLQLVPRLVMVMWITTVAT